MKRLWQEYQFRKLIHISHADYLEEPTANEEWFPQFAEVEHEVQMQQQERAAKEARG